MAFATGRVRFAVVVLSSSELITLFELFLFLLLRFLSAPVFSGQPDNGSSLLSFAQVLDQEYLLLLTVAAPWEAMTYNAG